MEGKEGRREMEGKRAQAHGKEYSPLSFLYLLSPLSFSVIGYPEKKDDNNS